MKVLIVLGGILLGQLTPSIIGALVIHVILLSADWLDGPRKSDPTPAQTRPAD